MTKQTPFILNIIDTFVKIKTIYSLQKCIVNLSDFAE